MTEEMTFEEWVEQRPRSADISIPRGLRYNRWAGNPNGTPYDPKRCAAQSARAGRITEFYQCFNKPGKGPFGKFCGTHARILDGTVANARAEKEKAEKCEIARRNAEMEDIARRIQRITPVSYHRAWTLKEWPTLVFNVETARLLVEKLEANQP